MEKKKVITIISISTIIILSILFVIFFSMFKDTSNTLLAQYGLLGIAPIVIIMDFVIQPISPDVIVFSTSLISEDFILIAVIAGISSVIAGIIDHLIGRRIGSNGFRDLFGDKHVERGRELFKRWGPYAVLFGALSPVPYSAVCWLSGIYRMKLSLFIVLSLVTRIPRFILWAYLARLI
ncbi:MAG: VTT domain-containing protein [archaeon]|nr:VTT domain-containing protein [Nanoarchaeota archaeon]